MQDLSSDGVEDVEVTLAVAGSICGAVVVARGDDDDPSTVRAALGDDRISIGKADVAVAGKGATDWHCGERGHAGARVVEFPERLGRKRVGDVQRVVAAAARVQS